MKILLLSLLTLNALAVSGHWNKDCQQLDDNELIWEYNVRRPYRIGAYQEVEAEYGPRDVTVTCIKINSLSEADNGAVWIDAGGVGRNFIRIKFRSKYSRGIHYRVLVYGKPTSRMDKFM